MDLCFGVDFSHFWGGWGWPAFEFLGDKFYLTFFLYFLSKIF